MSKFLEFGAAGGAAVLLTVAYNFADRNVSPMPATPDRTEAIAAYTAPPPSPMLAAIAQDGDRNGKFGLGRPALPEEIAAWDLDVLPDGRGLPVGSGDVWTGEEVFEANCAVCHGSFAEGVDNWPKLAGGMDTLDHEDPLKTVGSYWPHLSTAWDYINRSMPFGAAQTLSADDVYAMTAYILYSNDLVDDDFVLSNENLASFEMPNKDGFIIDDRDTVEAHFWKPEPCMENCKDSVEITMRATVLDVTPEEEGTEEAAAPAPAAEATEVAMADTAETAAPAAAPAEGGAPDPALVAAGEKVFRQCKACHQVGEGAVNRSGPQLNGIMGRVAGTVDGFRYSSVFGEFAEQGMVWNEETLSAFLTDPKAFAKGTKMSFRGIKSEDDLKAVEAYLATFTE
ncbi:MAG: c-type cytochrome [Paracoccaceae bacterium]